MEQRIGTVCIQDADGEVLLERPLADEFGFRGVTWENCFFAFDPKDAGDAKACMMKTLDWSLDKKPLTLAFGSMGPFTGYKISNITYDEKTGSIRILTEREAGNV
jgi:hypothetical protein